MDWMVTDAPGEPVAGPDGVYVNLVARARSGDCCFMIWPFLTPNGPRYLLGHTRGGEFVAEIVCETLAVAEWTARESCGEEQGLPGRCPVSPVLNWLYGYVAAAWARADRLARAAADMSEAVSD